MSFDLCTAFDQAPYLDPQLYLLIDSMKGKLPKDTILHINTNRPDDDKILKYISKHIPTKIYKNDGNRTNHLKSRCKYMLNCLDIESDKEWLIKLEADMIVLKHLKAYEELLEDNLDIVVETEARKIFPDNTERRLWRVMYKAMGYPEPTQKVRFRENNEEGLALFGTGIFCVRNKHLKWLSDKWIELTERAEPWLNMNVHPNEQSFTCSILNSDLRWEIYPPKYKFNPISHFRKEPFPCIELIDNPILPQDTIIADYHRSSWLYSLAKTNPQVMGVITRNRKHLGGFWDLNIGYFQEKK